ncbi:hypothetical protein ACFSY7_07870 [Kurthia populi]|uniref:Uncharacterized protein n=1 Tax=Kurthia populi TaxID=1562132 RepID=A0ABW5Y093_9BACL
MSIQQQLQDLSRQIADLSMQVEQSTAQSREKNRIDYTQLMKTAKQYQFTNHRASKLDAYVKATYMQILCSLLHLSDGKFEERLILITCIADSMGDLDNIRQHMIRASTLTEKDITDFIVIMKEQQLDEAFAIDALMLIGISMENGLVQSVTNLLSLLEINEESFIEICQFVNSILTKNYTSVKGFLLDKPYLKKNSKPYIRAIFKDIYINDSGTRDKKIHSLIQIIDKKITKNVVIKNAKVKIDENIIIGNLTEITLENCQIYSDKLDVVFENTKMIKLKNINLNTCKKYKQINISNVAFVEIDKLKLSDKVIYTDYPIVIKGCKNLILKNSKIVDNVVNPLNNNIRQKNYRGVINSSKLLVASFIHCEGSTKIELENNQFENNKLRTAKLTTIIN